MIYDNYNMIGNRLCLFGHNTVFCWRKDILKIVSQLTQDGYVVCSWDIMKPVVGLGFDFDCYIVLDTIENIEIREVKQERRRNIRSAPIMIGNE